MRRWLPQDVNRRSRVIGAIAAIITFLILGVLLIPNMESGLVFITIFGMSGLAAASSSGLIRYRARKLAYERDQTLPRPTPALTALAWIAVILAVYAAFAILSIWFLVPNDPSNSTPDNIRAKLRIIAAFGLALTGLIFLARWSFEKRAERRGTTRPELRR